MTEQVDQIISKLLSPATQKKGVAGLSATELAFLMDTSMEILKSQPALLELEAPIQIVGDVHGQFTDLLRLFENCGFPPDANYLFLGDYVDRGKNGVDTIALLLAYKVKYPENFFLLRGNHECASINRIYGFYDECKRRYNIKTWKKFQDVFNVLPLAAVVDEKIFCIHAGLVRAAAAAAAPASAGPPRLAASRRRSPLTAPPSPRSRARSRPTCSR